MSFLKNNATCSCVSGSGPLVQYCCSWGACFRDLWRWLFRSYSASLIFVWIFLSRSNVWLVDRFKLVLRFLDCWQPSPIDWSRRIGFVITFWWEMIPSRQLSASLVLSVQGWNRRWTHWKDASFQSLDLAWNWALWVPLLNQTWQVQLLCKNKVVSTNINRTPTALICFARPNQLAEPHLPLLGIKFRVHLAEVSKRGRNELSTCWERRPRVPLLMMRQQTCWMPVSLKKTLSSDTELTRASIPRVTVISPWRNKELEEQINPNTGSLSWAISQEADWRCWEFASHWSRPFLFCSVLGRDGNRWHWAFYLCAFP